VRRGVSECGAVSLPGQPFPLLFSDSLKKIACRQRCRRGSRLNMLLAFTQICRESDAEGPAMAGSYFEENS
jgi:hypothetical protein